MPRRKKLKAQEPLPVPDTRPPVMVPRETFESALEILEMDYGPCEADCPCIIHPMQAVLDAEKVTP